MNITCSQKDDTSMEYKKNMHGCDLTYNKHTKCYDRISQDAFEYKNYLDQISLFHMSKMFHKTSCQSRE